MSLCHDQLLSELRSRIANVEPLPGDKYIQEDETLLRFLKAREWSVDAAEKQLREAIEWRRSYQPHRTDCRWCHEQPGFHSMRQVGFDEAGRPVIYSCFAQADATKNALEDTVAHCTYLIENAKKSMPPGISTWIFVIDCTGLSLPQCNPSFANGVVSVFSNFYPEQMERIVCVNHSPLFHGVWNAIKVFIDPKTVRKMKFVRGKEKTQRKFREFFGDRLAGWLLEEIRLNKLDPMPESQERFWEAPMRPGLHDPRGCADYVERLVDPFFINLAQLGELAAVRPHPNLADQQTGRLAPYVTRARRKAELKGGGKHKKAQQNHHQQLPAEGDAGITEQELLAAYGVKPVSTAELAELESGSEDDDDSATGSETSGRRNGKTGVGK